MVFDYFDRCIQRLILASCFDSTFAGNYMDPLEKAASDLQKLARHFGDRQNSDSTLTAKECTFLVTACLNGGNHLEMVVRERKAVSVIADEPMTADCGPVPDAERPWTL